MIFHENHLLADDSHEISNLIFFRKLKKMLQKLPSAAVVIGALRVKCHFEGLYSSNSIFICPRFLASFQILE